MEIIIHGKPNAGSAKATKGIDGALAQHIVDGFFQGMSSTKDYEALYVDARYWKNTWYAVYTYQLGVNIKDTADRVSYFAISMVIPSAYYCLVSEVYKHLKKVCAENVLGTYLSKNGKYQVQNFEDVNAFNAIVAKVDSKDYVNLKENFDAGFKPQEQLSNNIYYHLLDCDSKAFVEQLRQCGRIIVSESAPTKDSIVASANKFKQESLQKGQQVATLQAQVEELDKKLKEAHASSGSKVKNLEKELQTLRMENTNLNIDKDTLMKNQAGLQKKMDDVASLLGLSRTAAKPEKTVPVKQSFNWLKLLPLVNTILLILLMLLMTFNLMDCYGTEDEKVQKETAKEVIRSSLHQPRERFADEGTLGEAITDLECKLSIYQDKRPVTNYDDIDLSKEIILTIDSPIEGYALTTENVKDGDKLKDNESFKLVPQKPQNPIIIRYGSDDKKKHNKKNIITINPKQH